MNLRVLGSGYLPLASINNALTQRNVADSPNEKSKQYQFPQIATFKPKPDLKPYF